MTYLEIDIFFLLGKFKPMTTFHKRFFNSKTKKCFVEIIMKITQFYSGTCALAKNNFDSMMKNSFGIFVETSLRTMMYYNHDTKYENLIVISFFNMGYKYFIK